MSLWTIKSAVNRLKRISAPLGYGQLFLLCVLHVSAVFFFVIGFFPTQERRLSSNQHVGTAEELQELVHDEKCTRKLERLISEESANKLIIVVIDAWRSGFYFNNKICKMPFLCGLWHNGQAFAFDAHLQTPSVTMPRIKAFTTGTVPSFFNVMLNFHSDEISDDNIVDRLKEAGFRILLCGDDSWFRLFPNRFLNESEGIVSFFVRDYVEVDVNVTRCMERKLGKEGIGDWDVMILHFLGIDHIGHSLGGTHKILDVKLAEIDSILRKLYSTLTTVFGANFWMAILGDHGMTDEGGHGGPSTAETFVPLIFVDGSRPSTNVFTDDTFPPTKPMGSFEQIDMVPTIASIMDIGIPVNSIGVNLLPEVFRNSNSKQQDALRATVSLLQNAHHFLSFSAVDNEVLLPCVEHSARILRRYCVYNETAQEEVDTLVTNCTMALRRTQGHLLSRETFFDLPLIVFSIIGSFMVTLLSLLVIVHGRQHPLTSTYHSAFRPDNSRKGSIGETLRKAFGVNLMSTLLSFLFLLQAIMFFASSFVEEEHDVQYFFFTTALFAMIAREVCNILYKLHSQRLFVFENGLMDDIKASDSSALPNRTCQNSARRLLLLISLLVIHRFCRTFTEGKRRRWLLEKQNIEAIKLDQRYDMKWTIYTLISSFGSIAATDVSQLLKGSTLLTAIVNLFASTAVILFFGILMKNAIPRRPFILPRQLSIGFLIVTYILVVFNNTEDVHSCSPYICYTILVLSVMQLVVYRSFGMAFLQWMALVMRPSLFPLIPFQVAIGYFLRLLSAHPLVVYFGVASSFFYSGNSNSLATVDVSVGYVCLPSYQPLIIALQLLMNTYSGPIALVFAWKSAEMFCEPNTALREPDTSEKADIRDRSNCVFPKFETVTSGYREETRNIGGTEQSTPDRYFDKKSGEDDVCTENRCASISYHNCTVLEIGNTEIGLDGYFCLTMFSRMSAFLLSLVIQRHHLFVWTVFAPKMLYETTHLLAISVYIIYKFVGVICEQFNKNKMC